MKYIKSPLNYTGGKYKLLPQIIPKFPKNINTLNFGAKTRSIHFNSNEYCLAVYSKDLTNTTIKILF